MKFSVGLAATALAGVATAYPMVADMVADASLAERQEAPDPSKRFNAKQQYVSTTGEHRFIAPDFEAGDQRGPCPGLNAMANHGYLPRNGVGSHLDFVTGTFKAFGMSTDLSGFLTVLGATLEGNGLAWSIGGPSDALPGVGSLIGQPRGISGSHNNYECDVSPGRGDLYTHGNDFVLQMDQYQQLYDMAIANGDNVDLPLLTDFRAKRFNDSIANNPYFFNGPFTGVAVQPAAYTFIFRFMGNKSAEHPQGKLNTDIMNTFFGVEKKKNGKLVKKPGMERFPENWYKRAVGDEYSIPFFNVDLGLAALKYPQFLTVGGNLGKVNTFTGVNPKDITGGVFNAKNLAKGNNAICFASQFMKQALPDALKCSGVLANIGAQMKRVTKQFDISLAQLSCPQLTSIDDSQFDKFPGYKNLNCKTGNYM